MRRYSRITGTGSYLPPRRVTNADLVAELAQSGIQTSDEWIVERTGIRARHFAAPDVTSGDLGLEAARKALEAAGCEPQDIDLIIVATSTPDMVFPSVACILQNKLGANGCPAFDVQAVCSGFVFEAIAVGVHHEHQHQTQAPRVLFCLLLGFLAPQHGRGTVNLLGQLGIGIGAKDRAGTGVGVEQLEVFGRELEAPTGVVQVVHRCGKTNKVCLLRITQRHQTKLHSTVDCRE